MAARATAKTDPFAGTNDTKEKTVADNENKQGWTITFKGGSGFDAPWLVGHLPSLEAVEEALDDKDRIASVMTKMQAAGAFFVSQAPERPATSSGGSSGGGSGAGARQDAPGGQTRTCKHGQMQYRSGSKNGRTWEAFMCPTPKGTADQCRAEFL